ncbi:MAG: putative lipid II flippase FtsW [bacterium]
MTPFLRGRAEEGTKSPSREMDTVLLGVVACILAIGVVMVYSASSALAGKSYGDELHFFKGQALRAVVGFVLMLWIASSDLNWLSRHARTILLGAFLLLALVLIPGIGIKIRGARRWLSLGFMTIQPAEFMKLALVVYLADFMTRREERLATFRRGVLPPLIVVAAACVLLFAQPSLGGVILLGTVAAGILLVGGARLHHLALAGGILCSLAIASILLNPYQSKRLRGFTDGTQNTMEEDYQGEQGILALGSGGALGKGFGHSQQKLFFLPDAHTDFIMAIVGEEMGFAGAVFVLFLYVVLFYRGVMIAWRSATRFKQLLALGLTLSIFCQAVLNLLVVTRLIPTTGQPLPFLSYGGSSLMFNLLHVGILLSLSRSTLPKPKLAVRDERNVLYDSGLPSGAEFLRP